MMNIPNTYAEFMEKHGRMIMSFIKYYKYTFTYQAYLHVHDDIYIECDCGGGDIYTSQYSHNEPLAFLEPNIIRVYNSGEIVRRYEREE